MVTTLRAAISVLLLLGFYLLAMGLVVGLGWASVWLWQGRGGLAAVKVSWLTIALTVVIAVGLWKVARAKPETMPGVPVTASRASELWRVVGELATAAKTRGPDEILLIPAVNAAVSEDARLLGLIGGRRRMYIGIPLLHALSVGQLRAILAHELGHFSGQHTRLGAVAYRGRIAIAETIDAVAPRTLVHWLFGKYAQLYLLVERAVGRRQELEADEGSVRAAGRETAQSALRELPVVDAAWSFYFGRYIAPGWDAGHAPRDFFGGFGQLLEARPDELSRLRLAEYPEKTSKWDSHPSIAARIAAMDAMPDVAVPVDTRPARALLPQFEQLQDAVAQQSVEYDGRKVGSWDEVTQAAATAADQATADTIYRAAARLGRAPRADLSTVLEIVRAGRLGQLGEELFPDSTRKEAAQRMAGPVEVLLRLAAVRSGAARWRHSWTGPAEFTWADDTGVDLAEMARLLIDPTTVDLAIAQLAAHGVDSAAATQVATTADLSDAEVVGAISDVVVDGVEHDLLILREGLILRPSQPAAKDQPRGQRRLAAFAAEAPPPELAHRYRFIDYEQVKSVVIVKNIPLHATFTLYDDTVVAVRQKWGSIEVPRRSREALLAGIKPFVNPTLANR